MGPVEKQLQHTVNNLKRLPFVDAIMLFGSYAAGRTTPLSDIDICVVDSPNYSLNERRKVFEQTSQLIEISLFSELPLPVKYAVLNGRSLFVRNKRAFYILKERVVLEYLDFHYILEDHYRYKKEAGMCVLTT